MDIKARGNALFRDGDFRGAAKEFQRALETAENKVKEAPTSSWIFSLLAPSETSKDPASWETLAAVAHCADF